MRHEDTINRMIERWNAGEVPTYERLVEALSIIEQMHEERLKLQRRIHNQRKSFRDNWEIVERRGNEIGSPAARRAYLRLIRRYRELRAQTEDKNGH